MLRSLNHKSCFAIIVLFVLLVSLICSFVSGVQASQVSIAQKGLSIIDSVTGLDTSKYSVTVNPFQQYLNITGGLINQAVTYSLQSPTSRINVSCIFTNDNLHVLYVLGSVGSPAMAKTVTGGIRGAAQSYLSAYASYTQNSLFTRLKQLIKKC